MNVTIGAEKRTDEFSRWVCLLVECRGYWRAVVSIAAKNAQLCWASLHYSDDFRLYSANSEPLDIINIAEIYVCQVGGRDLTAKGTQVLEISLVDARGKNMVHIVLF